MTNRVKAALSAVMIPVAFAAGWYLRWTRPWETSTDRAYRLCRLCSDLSRDEVNWLIDANTRSTLTREQSLSLFQDQFDNEADATSCAPCTGRPSLTRRIE